MADEVDNRPTEQKEREQWYKDQAAVIAGEKPDSRDPGEARVMVVEGNDVSDYVGVDPMYQNYANETEKPLKAEEGVDYVAESVHAAGGLSTNEGAVVTDGTGDGEVQVEEFLLRLEERELAREHGTFLAVRDHQLGDFRLVVLFGSVSLLVEEGDDSADMSGELAGGVDHLGDLAGAERCAVEPGRDGEH